MNQRNILVLGAVVILLLIATGLYMRPSSVVPVSNPSTTSSSSSTQHDGITATGDFQVSSESVIDISPPDFRKKTVITADLPADARTAIATNIKTLQERLAKNSFDLQSWIELGTFRKMAGDYAGAEEAWVFVTKAAPNNTLAFNNLGDLYVYSLKNYTKAEETYLHAIRISPSEANPYRELSLLYSNILKREAAAEAILKKGVAANPDTIDLHVLLARYYRGEGRAAEAAKEFDAAILIAEKTGQKEAAALLKTEKGQ